MTMHWTVCALWWCTAVKFFAIHLLANFSTCFVTGYSLDCVTRKRMELLSKPSHKKHTRFSEFQVIDLIGFAVVVVHGYHHSSRLFLAVALSFALSLSLNSNRILLTSYKLSWNVSHCWNISKENKSINSFQFIFCVFSTNRKGVRSYFVATCCCQQNRAWNSSDKFLKCVFFTPETPIAPKAVVEADRFTMFIEIDMNI